METRCIIHYQDGKTYTSDWNHIILPSILSCKTMSSIQLQIKDGDLYTLSGKKNHNVTFCQRDTYEYKDIISRSILKRIAKDIWLELSLCLETGQNKINILKEKIEIK